MISQRAEDLLDRFLRYVRIDTRSREDAETVPSTPGQWDLLRLLADELRALGCADVTLDEHGYVMATVPSTLPADAPHPPVVGFLAHVDTAHEMPAHDVKPQVWRHYQGGPIVLPGDPSQVIRPEDSPELLDCIGHDIVTSDGTTLLGADDKAGVAAIMTAVAELMAHSEIPHGTLRICFTPDEEVGKGTDYLDLAAFGAEVAYTIDASTRGEIEDESFSADLAIVTVRGRNVHPGYAKGKMVNAIRLAAAIVRRLPLDHDSPESTEGREGYLHPYVLEGQVERSVLRVLLRDFTEAGLRAREAMLRGIVAEVAASEPRATIEIEVRRQYRNMKEALDRRPEVVEFAREAIRRVGLEPVSRPIRGGTDGSRLTERGLPTPNLFDGAHLFHSVREWVSVQDMLKAAETIVALAQIWAERGARPAATPSRAAGDGTSAGGSAGE